MRHPHVAAGLILIAMIVPRAEARTPWHHVSEKIVAQVQTKFVKAFTDGGMREVVSDIRACYSSTMDERTVANQTAVASCLLYDEAAFQLYRGMTKALIRAGAANSANALQPESMAAYLGREAFGARREMYADIAFGAKPQFLAPYFGDAPQRIITALESSLRKQLTLPRPVPRAH